MAGIQNTQGRFNTGRDVTLVVIGPFGEVQLDNLTDFDCRQETANIKVDRLDGVQLTAELPKGWTGSFGMERASSAIDDLFAKMEQAWIASGSFTVSQIFQYVAEADGSTSTFRFDNVSMRLDDAGAWKGDASVKVKVSFHANRRERV